MLQIFFRRDMTLHKYKIEIEIKIKMRILS